MFKNMYGMAGGVEVFIKQFRRGLNINYVWQGGSRHLNINYVWQGGRGV